VVGVLSSGMQLWVIVQVWVGVYCWVGAQMFSVVVGVRLFVGVQLWAGVHLWVGYDLGLRVGWLRGSNWVWCQRYPSSYLMHGKSLLPSWPVRTACLPLEFAVESEDKLLDAVRQMASDKSTATPTVHKHPCNNHWRRLSLHSAHHPFPGVLWHDLLLSLLLLL
jgi:hypothetical protein